MQSLFTTNLEIDGAPQAFAVSFENEFYKFSSLEDNSVEFKICREDDEWHAQGDLPANLKTAAITALENYLLKQH